MFWKKFHTVKILFWFDVKPLFMLDNFITQGGIVEKIVIRPFYLTRFEQK